MVHCIPRSFEDSCIAHATQWEGPHELPSLLTEVVRWACTGELPALLCAC